MARQLVALAFIFLAVAGLVSAQSPKATAPTASSPTASKISPSPSPSSTTSDTHPLAPSPTSPSHATAPVASAPTPSASTPAEVPVSSAPTPSATSPAAFAPEPSAVSPDTSDAIADSPEDFISAVPASAPGNVFSPPAPDEEFYSTEGPAAGPMAYGAGDAPAQSPEASHKDTATALEVSATVGVAAVASLLLF
ncbi:classical arabinogalactan protein 11 [Vitis vinifera]|nr:classical arabinogalactan protein 11 [Vitis vinifera]|eukprot:XP_010660830.1 PREDICTED: classical arabinogalactan protein 11 [Vitis vinifera]